MSIAERIKAANDELVVTKDKLTAATTALEAAPDEDSLVEQVNELTDLVNKSANRLEALTKAEKALAAGSRSVADEDISKGAAAGFAPNLRNMRESKTPGELLWKHATVKLLAHALKQPIEQVLEERYGNDNRVKETMAYVAKSAVAQATTTQASWATELVREDTRGFIQSLEDVSVAAALFAQSQAFTFDGANSIRVPVERPLPQTPSEPAWVGEGGVIPLTAFHIDGVTLNPYKLAAITTMSQEIVQRSTPAIEEIVRNFLRKAFARVLDNALLTASVTAVAGVRPASIYNGVTPIAAGTGSPDENIRADILNLMKALTVARLGSKPVLIGNNQNFMSAGMIVNAMGDLLYRAELNQGSLLGVPVVSSAVVALNQLGMIDADYFAMAMGTIDFNVSDVATVVEANADLVAPTQANYGASGAVGSEAGRVAVDGGINVSGEASQGAGAVGFTSRSLWQTYSLGIRMVSQVSWSKLNTNAAQVIAVTDWN